MNRRAILAFALSLAASLFAPPVLAADSAVILTYYRFGEDAYPTTNTGLADFDAHLAELTSGKYRVLPLLDVLSAIREGRALPDRTIAITMDDGFASVYTQAWPKLRAAKLPFTIFVATASIDAKSKGLMSWDQLRELSKQGVAIAAQTRTHPHMVELSPEAARAEIDFANRRIAAEIGTAPLLFSFPSARRARR